MGLFYVLWFLVMDIWFIFIYALGVVLWVVGLGFGFGL